MSLHSIANKKKRENDLSALLKEYDRFYEEVKHMAEEGILKQQLSPYDNYQFPKELNKVWKKRGARITEEWEWPHKQTIQLFDPNRGIRATIKRWLWWVDKVI